MDWRDELRRLPNQLWYMYERKLGTDLQISVTSDHNQQVFHCHKMIMRRLSCAFEPQADGEMLSSLDVGDVDPEIFSAIIKFAYTDKIVFKSFASAIQIHMVATKYQMNQLCIECEDFVQNNLDKDSVWTLLSYSNKGVNLSTLAEKYLVAQTSECLQSPEFLSCSHATLELMLSKQELKVHEIGLLQAVKKWTKHKNGGEPFNSDDAKRILGPCLGQLRFLCLSSADFSTHVDKSGLISNEDAKLVLKYFTKDYPLEELPSHICKVTVPRDHKSAHRRERTLDKQHKGKRQPDLATKKKNRKTEPFSNNVAGNENKDDVFCTRPIEPCSKHLAKTYESPTSFEVDLQLSQSAMVTGFRLETQVKRPNLITKKIDSYAEKIQISVYNPDLKKLLSSQVYVGRANYGPRKYFDIHFKMPIQLDPEICYSVVVCFNNFGLYSNSPRLNYVKEGDVKMKFSKDDYPYSANPIVSVILRPPFDFNPFGFRRPPATPAVTSATRKNVKKK